MSWVPSGLGVNTCERSRTKLSCAPAKRPRTAGNRVRLRDRGITRKRCVHLKRYYDERRVDGVPAGRHPMSRPGGGSARQAGFFSG